METVLASSYLDFSESRSRFNSYFGNMGETIALEALSKEGFDVWRWSPMGCIDENPKINHSLGFYLKYLYPRNGQTLILDEFQTETYPTINPERILRKLNRFFGQNLTNLKNYIDTLGIFPLPRKPRYIPDLVAKKENEIYIIEVKVNSGTIYTKRQEKKLEALMSAREFNLIPLLVHFELELEAKNFTAKKLK